METLTQFSVFLASKPGVLSQTCRELAAAKVNIRALAMMDAMEHGVLRLIADDDHQARAVLTRLNLPTTETEVLAVPMPNRPGAVADVCEKLSAGGVHVSYVYCTAGDRGKQAVAVFKVADIKKAKKVLDEHKAGSRDMKVKLRRPAMRR